MKPFLLYFGCWDRAGHFLFDRNGSTIHYSLSHELPFRPVDLDGSSFFLPHPERVGKGALTHVVRNDEAYTVLAWWGSPFDTRGAVNAAIISNGWDDAANLWQRFTFVYPDLAAKLTFPDLTP